MAAMWAMSRDKGVTVAELMELSPYDLTLEWMAREAFLAQAASEARRWQAGAKGPSFGSFRATWRVN